MTRLITMVIRKKSEIVCVEEALLENSCLHTNEDTIWLDLKY